MPRANRRRRDDLPPLPPAVHRGGEQRVTWRGRTWVTRALSGASSTRTYTCPGCHHPLPPGTAHVVVWPDDGLGSVDDRRHWHTACWRARRGR
ncbi:hypothetical protein JNO54_06610 [Janibacter sp. YIM B02568]|uniref:hypothetical protein n=1 Tax=Janibacter endophyticus TaxID=2806261 RepID=UPI00194FE189|nr:hypothetical protein [Janibacter endophyticus]MBM6545810.1 hypothetical protein [Janibacter endophyticus]